MVILGFIVLLSGMSMINRTPWPENGTNEELDRVTKIRDSRVGRCVTLVFVLSTLALFATSCIKVLGVFE